VESKDRIHEGFKRGSDHRSVISYVLFYRVCLEKWCAGFKIESVCSECSSSPLVCRCRSDLEEECRMSLPFYRLRARVYNNG
jgi:hypothetical protein